MQSGIESQQQSVEDWPSASTAPENPTYPNEEYTVGWISALPVEMAAAKGMLDEEHGYPKTPPQEPDRNTYALGRIGRFKVVIACLPKDGFGSSSAAAVARDMLFTFPNIRVGLSVGIGAGIPDYDDEYEVRDIRLGDVVIGSDTESGGVVAYDFGRELGDGSFRSISILDRPPLSLRTALSKFDAEHHMRDNKISQYVSEMLDRCPAMKENGFPCPEESTDRLFRPEYHHVPGKSCSKCDRAKIVDRPDRMDKNPVIHYGVIATGSKVIEYTPTREEIKRRHRAVCLDMEAAGLMNNFPCIVIRGISNYADSHKNDQWVPYAAATAAACAKEFLEHVEPKAIEREQTARDLLGALNQVSENVSRIAAHVSELRAVIDESEKDKVLNWLAPATYGSQQSDLLDKRQEEAGEEQLNSDLFKGWINEKEKTIFSSGITEAGKASTAYILANALKTKYRQDHDNVCIAYLSYNHRRQLQDEQEPADLLAGILRQLMSPQAPLPESMKRLYESHIREQTRPSFSELSQLIHSTITGYQRVFLVIDAIDKCQVSDEGRSKFLSEVVRIQAETGANIFASSRPGSNIWKEFKTARQNNTKG
ncbi:hypothetical protein TWF281_002638 [Arthrobotrys megalospora]